MSFLYAQDKTQIPFGGPCFITRSNDKVEDSYTFRPTQEDEIVNHVHVRCMESSNFGEILFMIQLYNQRNEELMTFNPTLYRNIMHRCYDQYSFPNPHIKKAIGTLHFGQSAAQYVQRDSPGHYFHAHRMYTIVRVSPPGEHDDYFHLNIARLTYEVEDQVTIGFRDLISSTLFNAMVAKTTCSIARERSDFLPQVHGNIPCASTAALVHMDYFSHLSCYFCRQDTDAIYSQIWRHGIDLEFREPNDRF